VRTSTYARVGPMEKLPLAARSSSVWMPKDTASTSVAKRTTALFSQPRPAPRPNLHTATQPKQNAVDYHVITQLRHFTP
jgi:hypothetical protein